MAPPGELRVNADVVLLAGNTVWSTPERIRGEVLTTMRYTNRRLPYLPLPTVPILKTCRHGCGYRLSIVAVCDVLCRSLLVKRAQGGEARSRQDVFTSSHTVPHCEWFCQFVNTTLFNCSTFLNFFAVQRWTILHRVETTAWIGGLLYSAWQFVPKLVLVVLCI